MLRIWRWPAAYIVLGDFLGRGQRGGTAYSRELVNRYYEKTCSTAQGLLDDHMFMRRYLCVSVCWLTLSCCKSSLSLSRYRWHCRISDSLCLVCDRRGPISNSGQIIVGAMVDTVALWQRFLLTLLLSLSIILHHYSVFIHLSTEERTKAPIGTAIL